MRGDGAYVKNATSTTSARRAAPLLGLVAALAAVPATAAAGSLAVTNVGVASGTLMAGSSIATNAATKNVVARLQLVATGAVTVNAIQLEQRGTALPSSASTNVNDTTAHQMGAEIAGVQLWTDNGAGAPGTYLGTAGWSASQRRFVIQGLKLAVSATTNLVVTLAAGTGAVVNDTVILDVAGASDVRVDAASTVSGVTAGTPGTFTFTGNTVLDGSTVKTAPMAVILNPGDGSTVTSPFRVQIQVFDPNGLTGLTVTLTTDNGTTAAPTQPAQNTRYSVGANAGVWDYEGQASRGLTLAAGSYTLRAKVFDGTTTVFSGAVVVNVSDPTSRPGDGNLLVRDNASQMCMDCHAIQTHSSQATMPAGTTNQKYGSWANTCRDCHTPHRTTNVYVLKNRITAPSINTYQPARTVSFSVTTGDTGTVAVPVAQRSYVNSTGDGPCQVCHTRTQNPGNAAARWRNTGNADTHYTKAQGAQRCTNCHQHQKGFAVSCTSCHGDSTDATRTPDQQISPPLDTCRNTSPTGTTTPNRVGAHLAHLRGRVLSNGVQYGLDANACVECHTYPPVGQHPGGNTCDVNNRVVMTWGTLARSGGAAPAFVPSAAGGVVASCSASYCHGNFKNGNTTNSVSWNSSAATCGSCHAIPPAGTHPSIGAQNCGNCHPGYNATPGSTNGTVNKATHINGQIDGGEGGTACDSCHKTITSQVGSAPAATVKSRHQLLSFVQSDAQGTAPAWNTGGQNLATVTPANRSCVNMCHGDHPHDLTSPTVSSHEYNVYLNAATSSTRANGAGGTAQTRTSATRSNTDYTASGTGGLCLSCHGVNAVNAQHPVVDKTEYDAAAHNYTNAASGTTTSFGTWQYVLDTANFQRNCTKCHAGLENAEGTTPTVTTVGSSNRGVHYSTNDQLLAGVTNAASATNTTRPTNFVCYNCHGDNTGTTHNLSNKNVWTVTQKAYFHPTNTDTKHNLGNEAAATYNNGAFSGTNRHAACQDCHDPHAAKQGVVDRTVTATAARNVVPNALTGASGVLFNYASLAAWTTPVTQHFSTNLVTATLEYQVCFKCHSAFAFGTSPPTNSGVGGTSLMAETDVAYEFNPANKSTHPVVAVQGTTKQLNATQLVAPWNTNAGNQTMKCTDCHSGDAAAPVVQGPHGSAAMFMLTGTNRTWPGTFRSNQTNTSGSAAGLFCLNCHPQTNAAGSNNLHTLPSGGHSSGFVCTGCHIQIPHGGKISRLWVTTNAPARYKVGTPLMTSMGKAANYRSYTNSNFKSTCSSHSGGAGGEAW
jgi:predicted CxxxxCH...CXXCH cytochrome family protein